MFRSTTSQSRRRMAALVLVGVVTLTACGGSDDTESADPGSDPDDVATESDDTEPGDTGSDDDASDDAGSTTSSSIDEAPLDTAEQSDDTAGDGTEIAFLEPASTIAVDLAPGDGVELAVSPDGAYVASVSSQNEVAPESTLTTYDIATGEVVARVVATENGTIGSGPTWLADGRIVVRNDDTIAAWTGPDLEPAEAIVYDTSSCSFGRVIDADRGASFAYDEFAEPPVLCRIDLTTGDVTTAVADDVDEWFVRTFDGTVSFVREGDNDDDTLVTLDATTLDEVDARPLGDYRSTNAGLLLGDGADTVLVPGDIPIPSGGLSIGARLSDNGRVLIDGDGFEEIWLSTADGLPIGQVESGFATWQYGWSSDDSVVARPVMGTDGEVAGIDIHVLD